MSGMRQKCIGVMYSTDTSKWEDNVIRGHGLHPNRCPYHLLTDRTAPILDGSMIQRSCGPGLDENPDGSNNIWGENPQGLKNKVSCTMTIIAGLVEPKGLPKW